MEVLSSKELVRQAWEASGQRNVQRLEELVGQCVTLYGKEAKEQEKQLTGFPQRGQEEQYQALNSVATCFFIRAEALMNAGKTEEAVVKFRRSWTSIRGRRRGSAGMVLVGRGKKPGQHQRFDR